MDNLSDGCVGILCTIFATFLSQVLQNKKDIRGGFYSLVSFVSKRFSNGRLETWITFEMNLANPNQNFQERESGERGKGGEGKGEWAEGGDGGGEEMIE